MQRNAYDLVVMGNFNSACRFVFRAYIFKRCVREEGIDLSSAGFNVPVIAVTEHRKSSSRITGCSENGYFTYTIF